jgi:hypothetical protein
VRIVGLYVEESNSMQARIIASDGRASDWIWLEPFVDVVAFDITDAQVVELEIRFAPTSSAFSGDIFTKYCDFEL